MLVVERPGVLTAPMQTQRRRRTRQHHHARRRSHRSAAAARPVALVTLPPGAALPSEHECAGRVVKTPEVRPGNTAFNEARGRQKDIREKWLDRVTGDFSGTTDEILQWTACKWGIDLDIVRAQAAKESYWHMTT